MNLTEPSARLTTESPAKQVADPSLLLEDLIASEAGVGEPMYIAPS
jgi:hypothetical protein